MYPGIVKGIYQAGDKQIPRLYEDAVVSETLWPCHILQKVHDRTSGLL
jgi:hypothetical protein